MNPIPTYVSTAPILCTINPHEIPARIEVIERMRTNLVRLDRVEHGLVLHFPKRTDIEADLHRFTVDEKRCCEFWGFAVSNTDHELTLRWDAPPDARHLLAIIAKYLEVTSPSPPSAGCSARGL